jgi:chromosome segregation ATPase
MGNEFSRMGLLLTTIAALAACGPGGVPVPGEERAGEQAGQAAPANRPTLPPAMERQAIREIRAARLQGQLSLARSEVSGLSGSRQRLQDTIAAQEADVQRTTQEIASLRQSAAQIRQGAGDGQREVVEQSSEQKLSALEAGIRWNAAAAQLGSRLQLQQQRVQQLAGEVRRQEGLNLDTDELRRDRQRLEQERSRLAALESETLAARLQAARATTLGSVRSQLSEQAGQRAVAADIQREAQRIEEEIRAQQDRQKAQQRELVALKQDLGQLDEKLRARQEDLSKLEAESGQLARGEPAPSA